MAKRNQTETFDPLAGAMRREARLTRPAFSESLDARLQAAVRSLVPRGPQAEGNSCRTFQRDLLSWATAAAAAIALLVGSALFWHSPAERADQPIAQATPIEPVEPPADDINSTAALLESTASGLGQWMETTVDDKQWAGLDRDAQTAMATVTAPLPFDLSGAIAAADPEE